MKSRWGALLVIWVALGATGSASIKSSNGAGPVYFLKKGERIFFETNEPLLWQRLHPDLQRSYDNTRRPPLDFISYRSSRPRQSIKMLFRATKPGTFYVAARKERFPESFSERDALHRKYRNHVVQIVVRNDDSYLGYLEELLGTPFVMAPTVLPSGYHQTDQRVGSDCAAFATYGQRRLRNQVIYGGPSGIVHSLTPLYSQKLHPPKGDGLYRLADGSLIPVGGKGGLQPGDIVYFGEQVSVFQADRGRRGYLDSNDLLFQSWGKTPHRISIRKSGFAHLPIQLFRWNQ